jgi:hypothetical protein
MTMNRAEVSIEISGRVDGNCANKNGARNPDQSKGDGTSEWLKMNAAVVAPTGASSGWRTTTACCLQQTSKHYPAMKALDRRVSVAPMMHWIDRSRFDAFHQRIRVGAESTVAFT